MRSDASSAVWDSGAVGLVLWCGLALGLGEGEERAGGEDGHRHSEDYAHQQPVPVFSVGPGGALSLAATTAPSTTPCSLK